MKKSEISISFPVLVPRIWPLSAFITRDSRRASCSRAISNVRFAVSTLFGGMAPKDNAPSMLYICWR